jgi:hypothetical protein
VDLPSELHSWATAIAENRGQDLRQFLLQAVEKEVDRHLLRGGPELVSMLERLRETGVGFRNGR